VSERIRKAQAQVAEREHLQRVRMQLVPQAATLEQAVNVAARELQREQADVDRLGGGVIGFLNDLLSGQLSREQLEVQQAAARLREAVAARNVVRDQIAAHERRITELASADAELAAARAEREQELLGSDSPIKADLQELDIQVMSIDIELVPFHEAVVAGHAALAALAELIKLLQEAAAAQPNRKRAEHARGVVGEVEGKLRVFESEVSDLASFEHAIPDAHRGDLELGPWIEQLLAARADRGERIASAHDDLSLRISRLRARLEAVRTRHDELAARRAAILAKRIDLLTR
jgi:DNA repair exonuclease SbcCD ATPase subunit